MNLEKQIVTLIKGDGIGPEISEAVLKIIFGAQNFLKKHNILEEEIDFEEVIVGEKLYKSGFDSGISPDSWKIIKKNSIMLKAPITTPTGGGYKSLNVTLRKKLGLFANVRPSVSYFPIIQTSPKDMDLVIIRENEEDLYSGIEYRSTNGAFTSLKLLTKEGSLKICHFAFEYAKANNRKKVTCMIKDNIMKQSDGMFYNAFLEVAKNYPEIQTERYIIDIGSARIADRPHVFDVIVTENLYGDIISDIASERSGSVGLAGSANIGSKYAMFEAIHGSAPLMAGKNTANPSAFLNGAILMLKHMNMNMKAKLIEDAFWKTLADGIHTKDVFREATSKKNVSTSEFANEIISRFELKNNENQFFTESNQYKMKEFKRSDFEDFLFEKNNKKKLVGFDFFIDTKISSTNLFAERINSILKENNLLNSIKLSAIMSKGLKVWPLDLGEDFCDEIYDYWILRFLLCDESLSFSSAQSLMNNFHKIISVNNNFDIVKTENLYDFIDNITKKLIYRGFSSGQGE